MEDAPRGVRLPEDEHLFKQPQSDPFIETDRVTPSVEGYFRIPAIWVGEAPAPELVRFLNPSVHHQAVLRRKLHCGVQVLVQRDGMFLFDFREFPLAPQLVVPGYRKPNLTGPYRRPIATEEAEQLAENYAVLRAQVMNVHQACLTTSERIVKNRAAMMGFPITSWSTHKALTLSTPPSYQDDTENLHSLGQNVLNNKDRVPRDVPLGRRVIELDVVEHSLSLLDAILTKKDAALVQLVEASYMSACRSCERRFGEALVLAWGVCEQLVSHEWSKLIDAADHSSGAIRMNKERKTKLTGRDYTASVMTEVLELSGRIDHELYRLLEVARKARNRWAHEMRLPKESEVSVSIRAMEQMLAKGMGVQLQMQTGGRGGVPQWNYWIWERFKLS
jgi:hypothetical protein